MNLITLFIDLANRTPDDVNISYVINSQPLNIRDAINTGDNAKLKHIISNKKLYANEVHVTVY